MATLLPDSVIFKVHEAILNLDIDRSTLLAGTGVSARLKQVPKPDEQLFQDLHALNAWRSVDGSAPLRKMLENAYHIAGNQREAEILKNALVTIANAVIHPEEAGSHAAKIPQKVVFLVASPRNLARVDVSSEIRNITERIRQSTYRDSFVCELFPAVRVRDLQDILQRAKPAIVHFSGHGTEQHELSLEHDDGRAVPVDKEPFSEIFRIYGGEIRCVVLNACHTAPIAEAVSAHIDVAIGSDGLIENSIAQTFAEEFYTALGNGASVETAFEAGNNRVKLEHRVTSPLRLYPKPGVDAKKIVLSP